MELMKLTPEFQTSALLESMVKVAEFQSLRNPNKWDAAVHMNLGRCAGHTTAINDFATGKQDIIVISSNEYIASSYRRVGVNSISIYLGNLEKLRGRDSAVFIFDACKVEDVREFIFKNIPYIRAKGIVLVGCV